MNAEGPAGAGQPLEPSTQPAGPSGPAGHAGQVPPGVLDPSRKLDVYAILEGLEHYRPRRKGWTWRAGAREPRRMWQFDYLETSEQLPRGIPLPAARNFGGIDPQPDCVVTTEIASGRFEDDLRRMRMAAWHGADHIMVIRTAGQSHFDGLIEGTPEGVGGVPITRKQLRATRKALDLIEDEVGRPINFHSYVSGVAGPEMATLFAEEGVNGAHQDPQYNVLYRNVNMLRSFVDAAAAKAIMASQGMIQIDGAHNANATAREAWKVMPELIVQHAINCYFSMRAGVPQENICLSTVPPTAPPAPNVRIDLPYAVAVRELFRGFKFRAQMNTRYIESDQREATVTHVLNLLITRLTSADIQSTITPDEGRQVPWHFNNIAAIDTAKQALAGMDGLREMVSLNMDGPLGARVREIKERALLFMEEIAETGYFEAVARGFFVDSGYYPERAGDGIPRSPGGGAGAGTVVPRDPDYMAPVCYHFGVNNLPRGAEYPGARPGAMTGAGPGMEPATRPCDLIDGCTLCDPSKIRFIDELDEEDNVNERLARTAGHRESGLIRPEVQWYADGYVELRLFLPAAEETAQHAALEIARRMGIREAEVVHSQAMHPAEGTLVEVKGTVEYDIDPRDLVIPEKQARLPEDEIRRSVGERPLRVVAATIGEDEHSAGMREIIDVKHGGIEKYGIECHYLGTSVTIEKLVDAAVEIDAEAILASTIITHAGIHRINLRRLHDACVEKGIRDRVLLIAGGTQISDEVARDCGMDAGFGRGTKGSDVASFIVRHRVRNLPARRGIPPS
ncbi:MAG: LuxR family transcriptional regulator [Firmicutes bacterium]|nr:LuxR family transcriptional regulator [Bacillota bacterium]